MTTNDRSRSMDPGHDPLTITTGTERRGPVQVLVVEDEAVIAADIRAKLQRLGYQVTATASTGETAIDQAERHRPDVVIMDIRLAGEMDGIAAGAIIRKRLRVPVVYLTAFADDKTFESVKDTSDPFGYLLKPVQERDLRTTVEVALFRHETECRLREAKQRLEQQAERQAAIAYIGLEALKGGTLEHLMDEAVDLVSKSLEADLCAIARYVEEEGALLLSAGVGWRPNDIGRVRLELDGTQYGDALESFAPVVTESHSTKDSHLPAYLRSFNIRSSVTVCIGDTRPWGVLGVHRQSERRFTDDDRNFLQSIVNVLTSAVERHRREALIRDLSTPVLPIGEGILMVPIIGEMDSSRAWHFSDSLLKAIRAQRAKMVVLDVTGLGSMSAVTAEHLLQTVDAARLMGSDVVVTGVSPQLAESMVSLGLDLSRLRTMHDLREGIEMAERMIQARKNGA